MSNIAHMSGLGRSSWELNPADFLVQIGVILTFSVLVTGPDTWLPPSTPPPVVHFRN